MQGHHLPPWGPRVFWGVPVPGYNSERSLGGREGPPRGGHCSESLHALPLQGGKPRALGCQARSLVNWPLSSHPRSSGLWACVICGHSDTGSLMALPPGLTLTSPGRPSTSVSFCYLSASTWASGSHRQPFLWVSQHEDRAVQ